MMRIIIKKGRILFMIAAFIGNASFAGYSYKEKLLPALYVWYGVQLYMEYV